MCSRFLSISLLIVAVAAVASAQLRVCADPDNLPFSNRAHQGFENRIASLLAHEMHTSLEYTWQRMGRGFVREVLDKHQCDVLLGIPQNFPGVITTDPYYRSTYVFVSLRDRHLQLTSFDDPDLKHLKIGVQVLSEEYAPPAQALGRRGLVSNLVGFETTGGSTHDIIDAVARKRVDAAVVWGPSAGYFAKKYPTELQLTPTPSFDSPGVMLAFSISMAVRKADTELRDRLDRLLAAHQAAVDRILRSYGVPLLPTPHREVAGE